MVSMALSIRPGEVRTRKEIVPVLGGSLYGGICPGESEKTVVLYSDERAGAEFGYRDGWVPAEAEDQVAGGRIFEYTGAGRVGDQTFDGRTGWPNGAVLNHAKDGRALHLFIAAGKVPGTGTTRQRYLGQFELNRRLAFMVRAALDQERKMRRVIVFRLQPIGHVDFDPKDQVPPAPVTRIELVPASVTAAKLVEPERSKTPVSRRAVVKEIEAERREAKLSEMLEEQLRIARHHVARYQIHIKGKIGRLLTDLYDETAHALYELKSDSSRESIRMALGQLLDYSRFVESATHPGRPKLVIALPKSPDDEDLRQLLTELGVQLTYPVDGRFIDLPL